MNRQRNVLAVISGPSGVGKGTVIKEMFRLRPSLKESVSCTTRAPRAGERDGVDYFFVSRERFLQMIEGGELLEYSEHFENYYGTPRAFVEKTLLSGDIILEIDVDGALRKGGAPFGGAHHDRAARMDELKAAKSAARRAGKRSPCAYPAPNTNFQRKINTITAW